MTDVIFLHGSWLGGWEWDSVAAELDVAGIRLFTPTLSNDTGLSGHRDEVLSLIDDEQIAPGAIAVAHSYGGMVATAVAADRPSLFRRIVYLDAFVPRDGQSAFDVLPEIKPVFEATVTAEGMVPPLPLAAFGIDDPEQVSKIEPHMRLWALKSHTESSPSLPEQVEPVFLQLAEGDFFTALAGELEEDGDWTVQRLPLAHLAPITHSAQVAEALRPYLYD